MIIAHFSPAQTIHRYQIVNVSQTSSIAEISYCQHAKVSVGILARKVNID
jgi:hypothetical protein